jgi:tetratricopeptide (TPR) repeat protein
VVTTPSAAIAPAAIPAAKPTQPAAPAVESVVAPAQLEVPDEASPIDDEVVDEEVIEISSEPSGPTWTERRALRRAQRMYEDGVAAMRRGQRQAAIELYRQALALRPKHALAAGALSDVYFDEGRFDFAVAYAEDAVKADFDTPAHHIRLGDAYVRTGSLDDARAQYRTARQLGSTRADDRLAKLSQSSGR